MINNLQSILTQSNLMTSDPVFVVYSKQDFFVGECDDYDESFYVDIYSGDYCKLSIEEYADLESAWRSHLNDSSYPIPEDPCSGEDFDPDAWEIRYVKKVDRFEQAFFIRENAQRFIENQSHHLSGAYIYVESAYRNPEWQQIRQLLIDKARIEGEDVSV